MAATAGLSLTLDPIVSFFSDWILNYDLLNESTANLIFNSKNMQIIYKLYEFYQDPAKLPK